MRGRLVRGVGLLMIVVEMECDEVGFVLERSEHGVGRNKGSELSYKLCFNTSTACRGISPPMLTRPSVSSRSVRIASPDSR